MKIEKLKRMKREFRYKKKVSLRVEKKSDIRMISQRLKIMFLSAIMLIFVVSCTHTEYTYYSDGVCSSEISYRGGKMHGTAKWFAENGKPSLEAIYKNGKLNGSMIRYHYNGKIESESTYVNDSLEGLSKNYNVQGFLISEITYEHGKRHGLYREYFPDGSPYIKGQYCHDQIDGDWEYLDYDGYTIATAHFENGQGILSAYKDGHLYLQAEYKNSLLDGNETYYLTNGDVEKIVQYKEGKKISVTKNN